MDLIQENLAEYGLAGIFIFVLIVAVVFLFLAKEKRDRYIRDQAIETVSVLGKLTDVIDKIYTKTDNLPKEIRENIRADLNVISEKIDGIKK